jgi:Ca-activated chloride channel family protein
VSTSTIGVGQDYNEELMSAMARGGSGNYWFIKSPQQLHAIFGQELQGLSSVVGKNVELRITPRQGATLAKVYNELAAIDEKTWRLSDLQAGQSLDVLVRFEIDADDDPAGVCDLSVSWEDSTRKERLKIDTSLRVKVAQKEELAEYPLHPEVQEQVVLFETARMKEEAVRMFDRGEVEEARRFLKKWKAELGKYPPSALLNAEITGFDDLDRFLGTRKYALYKKLSHYQSYSHMHGHFHSQLYSRLCQGPVIGDITRPPAALQMPVEAIVNSTDNHLSDSGQMSRAVHRAAGPELLEECRTIGFCDYGEAKITKAYDLPVKWVIHTVCPMWRGGSGMEIQLLRSCYANIMRLAGKNGIRTIAVPAIGVGAMQFPVNIAAENAFEVVGMHLTRSRVPAAVVFVCYDDATLRQYREAFTRAVDIM